MQKDAISRKVIISHKFRDHQVSPNTEVLILGTFNPCTPKNDADFFYGGNKNQLWELLPKAFAESSLKKLPVSERKEFCARQKIDFIDLIKEVEVDAGKEASRLDDYIDANVVAWNDIESEIVKLRYLRLVCFTRKSFGKINKIKTRVGEIAAFCERNEISFKLLVSPSPLARRLTITQKQEEWSRALSSSGR